MAASTTPGRGSEEQREAKKRLLVMALEKGHTRTDAAGLAGVHKDTLYAWLHSDPSFSDEVARAELAAVDFHLDCWRAGAKEDWRASMEFLARRRSADYARKDTLTLLAKMADELKDLPNADLLAIAAGDGDADPAEVGEGDSGEAWG